MSATSSRVSGLIYGFLLTVLAALCVSCSDGEPLDGAGLSSRHIRFNVRIGEGWRHPEGSRSGQETPLSSPEALTLRGGEKPLYLVPDVRQGIAVDKERHGGTTRSAQTSRDDIEDFGVFASLKPTADTPVAELSLDYMVNVEVRRDNGWSPIDRYLWPGQGALHFNAYSPYTTTPSQNSGVTSLPSAHDRGELFLAYATPEDVALQEDLLIAEADDVHSSPCDLVFNHALTAVRFATGSEMAPCRIKSVSLSGVMGAGRVNMETGRWSDFSNPQTFTVTPDITLAAVEGRNTVAPGTWITSEEETFLLIPQTLGEAAAISMVVEEYGMETTLTTPLSGTVWEEGTTVVYHISANPRLGSFMLDITDADGNPLEELAADYTGGPIDFRVKSVYGNPTDTAQQKGMPWRAEIVDDAGNVVARPQWLTKWTASGNGSAGLAPVVAMQSAVFEGVSPESAILREAEDINKTSGYRPFNLSNPTGQASVQNTANCYLIHAPGFYSIPLVYGNAVSGGKTNTSAYTATSSSNIHVLKNMVNHRGAAITDPYIYNNAGCTPADAQLIWEGRLNLVQNVQLSPDKRRLIFTVSPNTICQGNAIVAVRDAEGTVMWSWHIWVTPYRPDDDAVTVAYHGMNYHLMTQNLGQVFSGDRVNFKERSVKVRFTQVPDDGSEPLTLTIPLRQTGKIVTTPASYNYYQWGRKDPMISDITEWYTAETDYSEVTRIWTKNFSTDRTPGLSIISDYIRTPGYFWVSPHTPEVFPYYNLWNTNFSTTNEVKTVYDPSPAGYMVSRNVLTALQNCAATAVDGRGGPGVNVTVPGSDQVVFFPAQGYRSSVDGSIMGRTPGAEIGSVWTSRTTSTTDATVLVIHLDSDAIQVQGLEGRANAFGLRPCKEL